eukprot:scaffold9789_cov54-Attheya_sp.AAC.5
MNNPKRGKGITRGLPHPAYFWAPVATVSGILVLGYYSFLDEAPFTKRKRLIATSPAWERRMGDEEYKRVLRQYKGKILPPDHRACITVKRVGSRIALAANKFASENIPPEVIQGGSPYTYTVVRSDMANAFVLPNNHIFVFTGLFKYARDEDQLAAVLGHEQQHFYTICRTLVMPKSRPIILASTSPPEPATTLVPPNYAMKEGDRGVNPPEFASTHPSYESRISKFDEWMPEAMDKLSGDGGERCSHVREEMKLARRHAAIEADRREKPSSA